MAVPFPYSIQPLGDTALLIGFGNVIDRKINEMTLAVFEQLKALHHPAITDVVPAYASVAVYYDLSQFIRRGKTAFEHAKDFIESLLNKTQSVHQKNSRLVEVPVCYSEAFAPDLAEMATTKQLSKEEIIRLHTSRIYRVYMLGFLPGFAYMAEVDEGIAINRKSTPRTLVPAGSVGIAGFQTGVYPLDSPGGWQIIGRTPLKIFDIQKPDPVYFQPGDRVKFFAVTEDEFENYQVGHS